jgi:hypothetical protein
MKNEEVVWRRRRRRRIIERVEECMNCLGWECPGEVEVTVYTVCEDVSQGPGYKLSREMVMK